VFEQYAINGAMVVTVDSSLFRLFSLTRVDTYRVVNVGIGTRRVPTNFER